MRPLRSPGVRALVVVAFAIGLGLVAWASLGTTDLLDAWYPSSESGYWSDPTTDPLGPGRPPPPATRGATRNAARGNTARGNAARGNTARDNATRGNTARGNATRGATGNATRGSATDDAEGARGAAGGAGGAAEDARGAENAAPGAAGNTAGGAGGARGATEDPAEDTEAATRAAAEDTTEDAEETQAADPAQVWRVLGGIALALLLAVVVLAIRVNRRRRRAAPPESAREAPDRALLTDRRAARQARMVREGSPREAIIATWLDLERLVAAAGVPRRPSETSSELVVRVLDDREVPAAALTDLAALFREARFSTHEPTEALRERAAGDLDAVHAALGARGRGAEP